MARLPSSHAPLLHPTLPQSPAHAGGQSSDMVAQGGGWGEENRGALWDKRGCVYSQNKPYERAGSHKRRGSPFLGFSLAPGLLGPGSGHSPPGPGRCLSLFPQRLPPSLTPPSAPPWLPCALSKSPRLAAWHSSCAELALPAFPTLCSTPLPSSLWSATCLLSPCLQALLWLPLERTPQFFLSL